MSDVIHLLPDSVANQIAAGEVIQRPASVVKELMENAIDAGASTVQVHITDAGRTAIQVIDDGAGMSETDARLSFERHATSKIKEAVDLFALHTMGFRGEALASIAAVAQVELKTRIADNELGTQLIIAASQVVSQEVVACPKGSNFVIKNLFYNVPARRKFLKSNQTEMSNIVTEFERVALAHPNVALSLSHNDNELLNLPVTTLRQRIVNIFGKRINQELLDLKVETSLASIYGFVGGPDSAHKKGAHTYFFVNNRFMRHPYFHRAVMEAFVNLIPANESVSYFIYFDVNPENIDVNIHPTKTEIKFENEQAIWQMLSATVRESLGRYNAVPCIDFDVAEMPEIPIFDGKSAPSAPKINYNPNYNPFHQQQPSYERPKTEWGKLYEGVNDREKVADIESLSNPPEVTLFNEDKNDLTELVPQYFQYKGTYIVVSVKSGLMLIHQHRAHVCVLFEKYFKQLSEHRGVSQGLLFPEMLQLPLSDALVLDSIIENLSYLGFELSNLGNGSYAIQGVPEGTEGINPVELLIELIHSVVEKDGDFKKELYTNLSLSMARSVAIVPGQVLSGDEMDNLVGALFSCPTPYQTPDGKIVIYTLPDSDIRRIFK